MNWKTPHKSYNNQSGKPDENINTEKLLNWYISAGLFSDIWQQKDTKLRLFGNIGLQWNGVLSGFYSGKVEISPSSYVTYRYYTPDYQIAWTFPISLGARLQYKSNGIEIGYKFHANSMDYKISGVDFKTSIKRNGSFGIYFVHEFKN